MKNNYLKFILLLLVSTSCHNDFTKLSSGKEIDKRLVGVWLGSEKGEQFEGVQKSWEMTRIADGTFILDFKFIKNGISQGHHETGTWWIEEGKFHEFHDNSKETDVYNYKVLDDKRIKFSSEQMSVEMNSDNYEFIDVRK